MPFVDTPKINSFALYKKEHSKFEKAVLRSCIVSYGGGSLITSHAREAHCSFLFTKLSVTAKSLLLLSPNPTSDNFGKSDLDFSTAAAVTRVLVDTFVSLYHFGLEDCPEDEYQTRQLLLFWRDFRVRHKMGIQNDFASVGAFHREDLTSRLNANAFWLSIPLKRRKHLLKSNDILHSPYDIMVRAGFDADWHRTLYTYWSAHTHCDSVAFLRMAEQNRGMGQVNEGDIGLLATCLEYARMILNYSSDKVDLVLVGAEERGNALKDFYPLENIFPPVPWAGKTLESLKSVQVSNED